MKKEKIVYALGYFDGVHLGHQALLSACRELAGEDFACGAVTFTVHPQKLLSGGTPGLINTNEDRKTLLLAKVDTVLELSFTEELMAMPWQDFCQMLVREHGGAGFVCGSDFRFGKGGMGNAQSIQSFCDEHGLRCAIVPQQEKEGVRISSTFIRTMLETGNLEKANAFLGHPHVLSGVVTCGKQIGRTIGFPTANLAYPENLLKLPCGVYACKAVVEGQVYTAVANIGTRPTVNGEGVNVECHLIDFDGDLYGKNLQVFFFSFLRGEYKFPDLACLQQQIEKDKKIVENVMKNTQLHP